MMMRSAPAASAHLAEIPVPAPAPRMGIPCALLALHRSRQVDRSVMRFPNCRLESQGHDPKYIVIPRLLRFAGERPWREDQSFALAVVRRPESGCTLERVLVRCLARSIMISRRTFVAGGFAM